MDAFLQEYGFIAISIAAMGFMFYFFMILPKWYKMESIELMAALTGVPVEKLMEYTPE